MIQSRSAARRAAQDLVLKNNLLPFPVQSLEGAKMTRGVGGAPWQWISGGDGDEDNRGDGDHGFLIEWIFYWIESSQIKIFESIFELNFPGKKFIE